MAARTTLIGFAVAVLGTGIMASVATAFPPCGSKACRDEVVASGLSGKARAACLKQLTSECDSGFCSCTGGSSPCSCVCGDGLCGPSEDCTTCPEDCGPCVCCSFASCCGFCAYIDAALCTFGEGTVGAPGSVCDAATPNCVTPPASPGNCCESDHLFNGCASGPSVTPAPCRELRGTFSSNAVCDPSGRCLPTCTGEGAPCGACGNGICVTHCGVGGLVCVDNSTTECISRACTTDAECPAGTFCGANGAARCGSGELNACCAPCAGETATTTSTSTTRTTSTTTTTTTTTLPPCGGGPSFCSGACSSGLTCAFVQDMYPFCGCVPDGSQPCGDATFPYCNGQCPSGQVCGAVANTPGSTCFCHPAFTTACGDAQTPACGGLCPDASQQCGAFRTGTFTLCACVDAATACACTTNGPVPGVCPPGEFCVLAACPTGVCAP